MSDENLITNIVEVNDYFKKFKTFFPISLQFQRAPMNAREPQSAEDISRFLATRDTSLSTGMIPVITRQKRYRPEIGRGQAGDYGSIVPRPLPLAAGNEHRFGMPVGYLDTFIRQIYSKVVDRPEPLRPLITYDKNRPLPAPYSNEVAVPLNWGVFANPAIPSPTVPDANNFSYADAFTGRNVRRTVFPVMEDVGNEGGFFAVLWVENGGQNRDEFYVVINDRVQTSNRAVLSATSMQYNNQLCRPFRFRTDTAEPVPIMCYADRDTEIRNIVIHSFGAINYIHLTVFGYNSVIGADYQGGVELGSEDKLANPPA